MKKSYILIGVGEDGKPSYYPAIATEEEISESMGQKLGDGNVISGFIDKETLIGLVVAIEDFEKAQPK